MDVKNYPIRLNFSQEILALYEENYNMLVKMRDETHEPTFTLIGLSTNKIVATGLLKISDNNRKHDCTALQK